MPAITSAGRPQNQAFCATPSFSRNDLDDLGIVDSSWLTDADWAVINRLRRIHETEGQIAVRKALNRLNYYDGKYR
jgi:hypothetical protein